MNKIMLFAAMGFNVGSIATGTISGGYLAMRFDGSFISGVRSKGALGHIYLNGTHYWEGDE